MTKVGRPPGPASSCPRCGAPRTVQAASTPLCPACLLASALDGDDEPEEAGAEDDEPPYQIVTVLARDADAVTYLLRHRPLSASERTAIARQLADALAAAHAHGLAHMRLDASHVKGATGGGMHATILGLGSSLIVSGRSPQPALDITALAALCRELGVSVP